MITTLYQAVTGTRCGDRIRLIERAVRPRFVIVIEASDSISSCTGLSLFTDDYDEAVRVFVSHVEMLARAEGII